MPAIGSGSGVMRSEKGVFLNCRTYKSLHVMCTIGDYQLKSDVESAERLRSIEEEFTLCRKIVTEKVVRSKIYFIFCSEPKTCERAAFLGRRLSNIAPRCYLRLRDLLISISSLLLYYFTIIMTF